MKTYFFVKTDSPVRGCNVRISVYRVKQNQPIPIGCEDHNTASWCGERGTAINIIHVIENVPFKYVDGKRDTYRLRGLLDFGDMYDAKGPDNRNAVRIFDCSGYLQ